MIKTYEGFLSHLKGKSKEQIISDLRKSDKDVDEIFRLANNYGLKLKLSDLYSKEDINNLNQKQKNKIIKYCIKYKNYELIPRNDKDEIIYDGNLNCRNIYLKELPDNLTVKGNLNCSYNKLTELPDNLTVNGYLDCSENDLTKLPNNLTVMGSLECYRNNLTELPDNLTVNGYLSCGKNDLTKLPDNLTVNGDLQCSYNKLTKLPDNLTVLPDNLTVKDDLWCKDQKSGIKLELPETAIVKGLFIN